MRCERKDAEGCGCMWLTCRSGRDVCSRCYELLEGVCVEVEEEERREERAEGCGMMMMLVVTELFFLQELLSLQVQGRKGPALPLRGTDAAGKRRRRHSSLGRGATLRAGWCGVRSSVDLACGGASALIEFRNQRTECDVGEKL
jgi:hypothetical protein